jgi:hypothetical protein
MAKKRRVPKEATRDEKLKIVADEIYTCAEAWIRACMENDGILEEFAYRLNNPNYRPIGLMRPPQC